ncbi:glycosyltransferase family 76 protein [Cristinia sonorae]|uniref:GPI mannosyltransferase 2 n=1 Tax=Cristinia sonorae TaxID=1940300 RepID=A0A8K0UY44_9AGAR|nr:glycosyltransferase family 76 protein [Cristinia sonorae]
MGLRRFSLAASSLSALLLYAASCLPLFDASPLLLAPSPLLRWDAFHYTSIAANGYVHEHQWAFFPGTPFVMTLAARLLELAGIDQTNHWSNLLAGGALACCLTGSATTLYHLTLHHTHSPNIAYLAALLSLIPTSPVTLRFASYSEPFFTYLSYRGMLYCARTKWLAATCCFVLAGALRSNGFTLSGFILWGLLIDPILNRQKIDPLVVIKATLYTAMTFVPFVTHQVVAYNAFCAADIVSPAPWCSNFPPLIYTYVQSKYWNVGFLRYWTLAQVPNFLMCAPILVILLWFTSIHIRDALIPRLLDTLHPPSASSTTQPKRTPTQRTSPFLSPTFTPHIIHTFLLTLLYIFASHTQIVLRQAAAMPTTYWAAAYLLMEKPRMGRWWVGWSVVWGAVSVVLWAAFLPPA